MISKFEAPNDIKNKKNKKNNINLNKPLDYLFNFSKKFFAILKVGITVLGTLIEFPFLGLRPILANLKEGLKDPNPLNSALFPLANAIVISFITISNTLSASLTVILLLSESLSIKSDFFNLSPTYLLF